MSKAVIRIGYTDYIIDSKDAIIFMDMLDKAEIWEEKWQSYDDGGTLYYAYPQDTEASIRSIKIIPDTLYTMAKLAGKPEK